MSAYEIERMVAIQAYRMAQSAKADIKLMADRARRAINITTTTNVTEYWQGLKVA